jgi:hypothetical protein
VGSDVTNDIRIRLIRGRHAAFALENAQHAQGVSRPVAAGRGTIALSYLFFICYLPGSAVQIVEFLPLDVVLILIFVMGVRTLQSEARQESKCRNTFDAESSARLPA